MNPKKINELDFEKYKQELEKSNKGNMTVLLDLIIEEFTNPFKDPREYITPSKPNISMSQLLYLLIDESERTFKKGIIVTGTVTRVLDNIVLCKLDNGLDGKIMKNNLEQTDDKLESMIQPGYVITGRIDSIQDTEEARFGATLNCKK
jgi:transcriptional accessory protein Tex/SPT6